MVSLMPVSTFEQRIMQLFERSFACLAAVCETTVDQGIDDSLHLAVFFIQLLGIVSVFDFVDLFHSCAEDIFVLNACLLSDLDVSAVPCTDRHCTVDHELHVAGTGSLCACGRDLLVDIRSRNDLLSVRYIVVGYEYDFHLLVYFRIVINKICDLVDVLDDRLCSCITRSSLCAENERSRGEVRQLAFLQTEIDRHDGECIHELSLVLMQTLYLNVKHEVRIDPYAVMLLNKLSKLFLLLIFDTVELVNCFVIDLAFQTLEVIKISDPLLADEVGDELRQLGVAKTQPAAPGNARDTAHTTL